MIALHCRTIALLQEGRGGKVEVFLTATDGAPNPTPAPVYPTAGTHLVPLKRVSSNSFCTGTMDA